MKKITKVAAIATIAVGISGGLHSVKALNVGIKEIEDELSKGSFINYFLDEAYTQIVEGTTYSSTGFTTTEDSKGNLTITGYTGSDANIEIPKTINGKPVTLIGDKAFQNNTTLKKLKISADITAIGEFAFCNCTSLEEVEFPDSLLIINGYAFLNDPIKELKLPSNLLLIKTFAFQDMKASEVELPSNLQELHGSAFRSSDNLKAVKVYSKNLIFDADHDKSDDDSTIFEYCPDDLVLYGYKGSTTETYASENHITFRELDSQVEVTGVTLNKSSLSLEVGSKEKLVATITPDNASTKSVTWTSSDEVIATVDSSGEVTGLAEGSATITAESNNGKKATCTVVVNKADDKGIYFVPATTYGTVFHLAANDEKNISVGIREIPETEIKNMTCTSSDTSIVTVEEINAENSSFKLKALKSGKVTLTASLAYSGKTYTASYDLDVKEKYADFYTYEITGENTVGVEKTVQLKAEYKILDAVLAKEDIAEESTWTSSNEEVLKVDGKGLVTGVKEGTATVTAKYTNSETELSAEYEVTVKENTAAVSKIEIQKEPSRTEYNVGDEINIDDGELLVTYEDGSTRTISMGNENVKVEGFDTSKTGDIEVTLTYEGQSVTLNFTVKEAEEEEGDGDDKGKEEEEEEKVDTGDNIIETIVALVVSALLIIVATLGIKNKKKKEKNEEK